MQLSDSTVDFILIICQNYVLCLTKSTFLKYDVANIDAHSIHTAIKSLILNAESKLSKNLSRGILLVDIEPLKKSKIKVLKQETIDIKKIKFDIEEKLNRKVISIVSLKSEDKEYKTMQVFTAQKNIINKILYITNFEEMEILEAQTLFEFLCSYIFNVLKQESCNFVKFNRDYCEVAYLKNGKIYSYETKSNFGVRNILQNLSEKLRIPQQDLKLIIENYRTISYVERVKRYNEREELDFALKDLIESTKFISSLHFELKQQMQTLKQEIRELIPFSINEKYYFFYDTEFYNLKLHDFENTEDELISIEDLSFYIFSLEKSKNSTFNSIYSQIKIFFRLNS